MLDFIYTLLIAPLEYWMHAVLVWGYDHTQVWGWAIVLMSLVVNIVILPIYIKAESWQEEERAIRKRFEAKERMIKSVFKGQERFAMISTMQRQAGFTPFLTLRSSIGFFLQIPFFFAAYHFLSTFTPLAGVSFLGLADLSKPDAAIALGGWSINVMPILMTVINLFSALVYTHNLTRRDKIQLYGMAAVFLVLLYDAASGLVLYWTCNNIFSLGKNIVYDLVARIRARLARDAAAPGWCGSAAHLMQPAAAPEAAPSAPGGRLDRIFAGGLLFWVWCFAALTALLSSSQMTLLPETVKFRVSIVSDAGFLLLAALIVLETVRLRLWRGHKLLVLVAAVILYYGLSVWVKWYFFGANRHLFALIGGALFLIPTLALTALRVNLPALLYPKGGPAMLFTPAAWWLVILITCYLPVEAYCTAPEIFSPTAHVLAKMILWAAVGGVLCWTLHRIFRAARRMAMAGFVFGLTALVFTLYAFLLPMNVGTIDAFQIADTAPLFRTRNLFLDLTVLLAAGAAFTALVRTGRAAWLRALFILCTVAALGNGALSLWQSQGKWRDIEATAATELPAYNDRLFGFSKTAPNTVVVMLDAFTGTHVRQIMAEHPELVEAYRGFTWHSDAVATGGNTITSVASILCGLRCTPEALNAERPENLLAESINRHYAELVNALGDNVDAALYERNWLEPQRLLAHTSRAPLLIRNLGDSYLNRYVEKKRLDMGRGSSDVFLLAVSLFNTSPWSMKNLVYKDGRWIEAFIRDRSSTFALRALRDWALFESLPEVSNSAAAKGTFKFIDTELTHGPWFMDPGECVVTKNPQRLVRPDGLRESHLATEVCSLRALSKWFDWMRRENVWHNTRVILVSDHGYDDSPEAISQLSGINGGRALSLLLIRDFGDEAPFRESDAPTGIKNVGELIAGRPEREDPKRRTFFQGAARLDDFDGKSFVVEGPLLDPASWRNAR